MAGEEGGKWAGGACETGECASRPAGGGTRAKKTGQARGQDGGKSKGPGGADGWMEETRREMSNCGCGDGGN